MILVDTHVLIWWMNDPNNLSTKAKKLLQQEQKSGVVLVSSMSVWEIYLLVQKGRLQLTLDVASWIDELEHLEFIRFIPVTNRIAAKAVMLPDNFHADPADRIIVATAREKGATLITKDDRIRKYKHVQTVW